MPRGTHRITINERGETIGSGGSDPSFAKDYIVENRDGKVLGRYPIDKLK